MPSALNARVHYVNEPGLSERRRYEESILFILLLLLPSTLCGAHHMAKAKQSRASRPPGRLLLQRLFMLSQLLSQMMLRLPQIGFLRIRPRQSGVFVHNRSLINLPRAQR